jgi:hypothetical protein
MTCLECKKKLSYLDHRQSIELFQTELCPTHRKRLERVVTTNQIPREAAILYYGLIQAGVKPMLAWWDGKNTVDLAVSRVKLNIEIDTGYESLSHEQAMNDLEAAMHSFKNGFTTIRIPHFLIRNHLQESVENILGIIEGLKLTVRVV